MLIKVSTLELKLQKNDAWEEANEQILLLQVIVFYAVHCFTIKFYGKIYANPKNIGKIQII